MDAKPVQDPYYVAANLAYRGDADGAFAWLDRAYAQRATSIVSDMTNEPMFENVRHDPRFLAFRRKLNLPP